MPRIVVRQKFRFKAQFLCKGCLWVGGTHVGHESFLIQQQKYFSFFKFNIWFTSCVKIIPCLYTLNKYIFTNRPWSGKYDLDQAENREKSVRYVCTQLRIRDMWQKGADFDEWTGSSWCVPPLTSVTTAAPPSSAPHSCFDGTHDSPKCCTLSQLELCKSLIAPKASAEGACILSKMGYY